mmetsp:Transcript_30226/g.51478  ORF Transcript_30226/g.51478 Transcript_30226/m.51478 type:complete len:339 (+) Transcript_30226:751-1767(+)|eukprot:CAMPEP_0183707344 /NCGR_PEP_ID=MMETSP0737-20130205/3940_1 /TAXON_ID=385413 /ORGANISM="Thalassiosira miniscula, Strain CCMP1093" /LENGTH=338 /DNA_ID=CAMNT_0025934987 /DNA_START=786 /DNA_END=1802 /DNA_ORIENTATION=+
MTITSDLRPTSPLPAGMLSNPDLTKLYMSASCPELKAESVISSSDEEEDLQESLRFEPLMETHDEYLDDDGYREAEGAAPLSMDCPDDDAPELIAEHSEGATPLCQLCRKPCHDDAPSAPSDQPATVEPSASSSSDISARRKLQWKFKGLTIWLELEEFDNDLTRAVEDLSCKHSSPFIPKPHTTAIYGMEHLSIDEAKARLARVRDVVGQWPAFEKPTGVTSSIAECGKPGQVCSIAWSELTLSSNEEHEAAMDALHRLFFGEDWVPETRDRPWKPHNSIAYDNPETNTLSLLDTVMYCASSNPTLLGRARRVEAISLWSTVGKMEEWECIDRVRFW